MGIYTGPRSKFNGLDQMIQVSVAAFMAGQRLGGDGLLASCTQRCRRAGKGSGVDGLDRPIQASPVTTMKTNAFEENGWRDGLEKKTMKMNSLMTGEEDLPRVATVINVGLRPRRIWNVLVVAVMMNGLDRGKDGPAMVGSTAGDVASSSSRSSSGRDGRSAAASPAGSSGSATASPATRWSSGGSGVSGGSHGCRPLVGVMEVVECTAACARAM
ncbi:hypothetical protein ACLOJK_007536 [Asimina triloba]